MRLKFATAPTRAMANARRSGHRLAGCLSGWLVLALAASASAQAPPVMPPARVKVAPVQQHELSTEQAFVGTVVPLRTSTVGSPVEGRVVEFTVQEGDAVAAGDVLVRLRTRQLEIELAGAKAQLEFRKQALAQLQSSDPEEIRQAQARLEGAKALSDYTTLQLNRALELYKRKTISEDDLQEKQSAAVAGRQKYLENEAAWKLAVGTSPAKLEQSQTQVQIQEEEILRLEDDIAEHAIVAPFAGFVTKESTEVGQWIAKGGAVVDVVEIHQVEIEVSVLEKYIPQVRLGMKAKVTMDALPGKSWVGEVTAIVPQADVRSRTFPVNVRLDNPAVDGRVVFMPGMFARVDLQFGGAENVFWVPKDAVVLGGQTPLVYAAADGKARPVPVVLGEAVNGLIEVHGPLRPGDQVVVEGNERLSPGRPLDIVRDDVPPNASPDQPKPGAPDKGSAK